jgi:hypothetical protein
MNQNPGSDDATIVWKGHNAQWKTKVQRQLIGAVSPRPPEDLGNHSLRLIAYIRQ